MLLLLFVLFKTTKVQAQAVDIGDISELNGQAQIVRDEPLDATLKFAIQAKQRWPLPLVLAPLGLSQVI